MKKIGLLYKKLPLGGIGGLFALLISTPSSAKQWTLPECINYAIEHNISLKQRENTRRQNEVSLNTAKNSRLPDLNAGVSRIARTTRAIRHSRLAPPFLSSQATASRTQSSSISLISKPQQPILRRHATTSAPRLPSSIFRLFMIQKSLLLQSVR